MENTITKNEVINQENRLYQAIIGRNIDTLEKLLHNNLLFIIPSGEVITKEIDLKTYRDGALKVDEITPKIETLNIIDDVAVIVLVMELKGIYNTEPFEVKYRYIRFGKQFNDGIKVIGGSGIAV